MICKVSVCPGQCLAYNIHQAHVSSTSNVIRREYHIRRPSKKVVILKVWFLLEAMMEWEQWDMVKRERILKVCRPASENQLCDSGEFTEPL